MEEKNENIKYAKDFICSYVDDKGNPCREQAVAFYPIWDIDQDAVPRPYCQKHLDGLHNEFLFVLYCPEEYERKQKKALSNRKKKP